MHKISAKKSPFTKQNISRGKYILDIFRKTLKATFFTEFVNPALVFLAA